MDVGMLWFDNEETADLTAKVKRAADYYQEKYGQSPDLCFVHPHTLSENGGKAKPKKVTPGKAAQIEVRPSDSLLPNHFWLGVNQDNREGD